MKLIIFIINQFENTVDKLTVLENDEKFRLKSYDKNKLLETKNNLELSANGFQLMRFTNEICISEKFRLRILSNRKNLHGLCIYWLPMDELYLDYKW